MTVGQKTSFINLKKNFYSKHAQLSYRTNILHSRIEKRKILKMFISLHWKLAKARIIVKIELSKFHQWKIKIYRIFKNVKKIKQLSENNKLKPIIKKHTVKTKLNKNNHQTY